MKKDYITLWVIVTFLAIVAFAFIAPHYAHAQVFRILPGNQGGTGFGTTTAGNIGKCLAVSAISPLRYTYGTCAGGSGGSSGFPTNIQNGGATLNSGTTTLNFTPNSFSITESPAATFIIRVATTTLGILASSISDFVSTVRTSISETVPGLTYTSATGVLSLDSGSVISTTTRESNQDTAFGWGNHALQGYLTTVDISANTNLTADGTEIILTNDALSLGNNLTFTNGTTTSFGITNLTAANCDVKSSTGGSLFCGTDATGASSGGIATTAPLVAPQVVYATGAGTVSSTPTTTLTGTAPIVFSNPISVLGAIASAISCTLATGSVTGCLSSTDWTSFNNKVSSTSIDTLTELETLQGSINIIQSTEIDTSSEVAGILTDETGTGNLVFNTSPSFQGTAGINFFTATSGTTTNATSSNLAVSSSLNLFGGGAVTSGNALCIQLTGSAGLCDGSDATGGGGGTDVNWNWTSPNLFVSPATTTNGIIVRASSTIGGGTNATGLTVNGGATTTGASIFQDMLYSNTAWGTGTAIPTLYSSGDRAIFLWTPSLGALVAGERDTGTFSSLDIGGASTNLGYNNSAKGYASVSLGQLNEARADAAMAIGYSNISSSTYGVAMGRANLTATGTNEIAIGTSNTVSADYATVIGFLSSSAGIQSMNLGTVNTITAPAFNSVALGSNLTITAPNAITIGTGINGASQYTNTATSSIYLGSNSNLPTLALTGGFGAGTHGNVGISSSSPSARLTIHAMPQDATSTNLFRIASSTNTSTTTLFNVDWNGITTLINASTTAVSGSNLNFTNATTSNLKISALIDSANTAGTNGMVLKSNGSTASWVATSTLGFTGGGGVSSVDATVPTGMTISGNPITTSGTLAFGYTAGFSLPLTASTTEGSRAYASTSLLNATSPIVYTSNTGNFSIGADTIGDTQLAFNTGQNLTTASTPTFTGIISTTASTSYASTTGLSVQNLNLGSSLITSFGNGLSVSAPGVVTATLGTTISASELANDDFGFFSTLAGVASLDANGLTSANLSNAVSDETGTGNLVFNTSPAFQGTAGINFFTATSGTTTNATSTNLSVSTSLGLFGSTPVTSNNALCIQLTGSASLCDGTDATGAGGAGTISTSSIPTIGNLAYWTSDSALSSIATNTLTATAPIALSQPISIIGAAASVLTCASASGSATGCLTSGDWTSFNQKVSSTSIDTLAELETLMSGINIIAATEIDTSSEVAAIVTDEQGTGSLVFNTSPRFFGATEFNTFTATSGTTTNATSTNFNVSSTFKMASDLITDITGTGIVNTSGALSASLGTDIATGEIANGDWGFFTMTGGVSTLDTGGLTSTNLSDALTNETGTGGNAVFSSGPTFTAVTNFADTIASNGTTTNATSTNLKVSGLFTMGTDAISDITGSGLTNTANALTCVTGTGAVFGCLPAADFTTFMGKVASSSIDTSNELLTLLTDETGTGLAVFATNPLLTGFRSSASSTIGDGTAIGGLTVSGNSTTTGNALFNNTTAATSTLFVDSTTGSTGGRFVLRDTNGTTCTQVTALAGVLTAVAVTCP